MQLTLYALPLQEVQKIAVAFWRNFSEPAALSVAQIDAYALPRNRSFKQ